MEESNVANLDVTTPSGGSFAEGIKNIQNNLANMTGVHRAEPDTGKETLDTLKSLPKQIIDTLSPYMEGLFVSSKFQKAFSNIFGNGSPFSNSLGDLVSETSETIENLTGGTGLSTFVNSMKGVAVKKQPKESDLLKLNANYALPGLLIYGGLRDIIQLLTSNAKGRSGGGNEAGGSFKKTLTKLFEGVKEGAAGLALLAGALLAFAGASAIFSQVEWGSALKGLAAFTVFVLGSLVLAKILGKSENLKNLKDFALGTLLLTAAFLVFSVAIWIAGSIPEDKIQRSLAVLGEFIIFTALAVTCALIIKNNMQNFQSFAMGALLLTSALIAFSVAILIAGMIPSNVLLQGSLVVAGILGILLVVGAVFSTFGSKINKGIVEFAIAGTLLGAACLIMCAPIFLLGSMSIGTLVQGGIALVLILGMLVALGVAFTYFGGYIIPGLILFAIAGTLFGVALLLMTLPIAILGGLGIVKVLEASGSALVIVSMLTLVGGIGLTLAFTLPGILLFGVASAALALAMLPMVHVIDQLSKIDTEKMKTSGKNFFEGYNAMLDALPSVPASIKAGLKAGSLRKVGDALLPVFQTISILGTDIDMEKATKNLTAAQGVIAGMFGLVGMFDDSSSLEFAGYKFGFIPTFKVVKSKYHISSSTEKNLKRLTDITSPLFNCIQSISKLDPSAISAIDFTTVKTSVDTLFSLLKGLDSDVDFDEDASGAFANVISTTDKLFSLVKKLKNGIPDEDLKLAQNGLMKLTSIIYNKDWNQYSLYGFLYSLPRYGVGGNDEALDNVNKTFDIVFRIANNVKGLAGIDRNNINVASENVRLLTNMVSELSSKMDKTPNMSDGEYGTWKKVCGEDGKGGILGMLGFSVDSISKIANIPNIEGFLYNSAYLVESLNAFNDLKRMDKEFESLQKYSNAFNSFNVSQMDKVTEAFERFLAVNINAGVTSINELANNADKFERIAKAFDKMTKSSEKMALSTSVFGKLADLSDSLSMSNANKRMSRGNEETPEDKMYKLMLGWDSYIKSLDNSKDPLYVGPGASMDVAAVSPNEPYSQMSSKGKKDTKKRAEEEQENGFVKFWKGIFS